MSPNATQSDDSTEQETTAYHLVCHGCDAESIQSSALLAGELADGHEDMTGHTVTVGEVDRSEADR